MIFAKPVLTTHIFQARGEIADDYKPLSDGRKFLAEPCYLVALTNRRKRSRRAVRD